MGIEKNNTQAFIISVSELIIPWSDCIMCDQRILLEAKKKLHNLQDMRNDVWGEAILSWEWLFYTQGDKDLPMLDMKNQWRKYLTAKHHQHQRQVEFVTEGISQGFYSVLYTREKGK